MLKRLATLYPLLFAAFPVLGIAARNPGEYALDDLLIVLLVGLVGVGLVLGAATLLLRRFGQDLPGVVTVLAVAVFFFYLPLREWIDPHLAGTALDKAGVVPIGVAVVLAVTLGWFVRRAERLAALTRMLTTVGLLLVAWNAFRVALDQVRGPRAVARNALVRELAKPIPIRPGTAVRPRHDIYLLILDQYANRKGLQEFYGFDNRPFEDSLRGLGFTIPATTRSNYDYTLFSVPSLLNFAHMTPLEAELGNTTDRTVLRYLIKHNRLVRFLRKQGYEFVLIPGWEGSSDSPDADRVMGQTVRFDLGLEVDRTELREVLRSTTLLDRMLGPAPPMRRSTLILDAFDSLKAMASEPELTFTFAHLMMPHYPYRYDKNCQPTPPSIWDHKSPGAKPAYIGHLQCANRRVLDAVRTILSRSETPPIIVIQSDHGSSTIPAKRWANAAEFPTLARERFAAFGAYYLPDGGASRFGDTVTVVNVFRYLLGYYFNADLPPEPNYSYFRALDGTYHFVRADTALVTDSGEALSAR
jgi:hypothetical protein